MAYQPPLAVADVDRALAAAGARFSAMLRTITDPDRPAVGTWTVGETAAHAASSPASFLAVARGDLAPVPLDRVARHNARILTSDRERDPSVLAVRFEDAEHTFRDYVASVDGDPSVELFKGVVVGLPTVLAVELAEVLVHGHDIARACGLGWEIPGDEAAVAAGGILPILPHAVDRSRAAGFDARVELRIRGGAVASLVFTDGMLRIESSEAAPVDCHLSVDPSAYLLLMFKRTGWIRPTLRGKLFAWGRRPWLAPALQPKFITI